MQLVKNNYIHGDVYTIRVGDIVKFFEERYPFKISNSGVDSFLKSLKIPAGYFLKQPEETRIELLTNQILFVGPESELLVFMRNDIVEYVSTTITCPFSECLERTPINTSWIYIEEDLKAGYVRFFYTDKALQNDKYTFGVFIDFPVLLTKNMNVSLGFYKIDSKDSDKNSEILIPESKVKIKPDKLPETSHNTYFEDMLALALQNKLDNMINHLTNINTDSDSCITLLLTFEKEKLVNKSQCKNIRNHIASEEVSVDTMLSLVEICNTFLPNITSLTGKFKFKLDLIQAITSRQNRQYDVNFLSDFKEGY